MPQLTKTQAQTVEDAESFPLLDAGVYMAALQEVTEEQGKNGPYWSWKFLLVEDPDGSELEQQVHLWENTSLSEKAAFRLKAMFDAFEVPADTDTDEILGQYVMVNVGQEVAEQGSKKGQLRNVFLSAFPAGSEDEG